MKWLKKKNPQAFRAKYAKANSGRENGDWMNLMHTNKCSKMVIGWWNGEREQTEPIFEFAW